MSNSPTDLLAEALAQEVADRLKSGVGFLRVPQFGAKVPFKQMIENLGRDGFTARVADFAKSGISEQGFDVTSEVTTAIEWRDDPSDARPLLILGDIHRNRAAGLAKVTRLTESGVRHRLFANMHEQASEHLQPVLALTFLRTLAEVDFDLQDCAEYCSAVGDPSSLDFAGRLRSELFWLGLLPLKTETGKISVSRLRKNADVLERVRSADPKTLQRLLRRLSDEGSVNFDALRQFTLDGDRKHLQGLELRDVEAALVGVREETEPGGPEPGGPEPGDEKDLFAAAQVNFDEAVFLEAVKGVSSGSQTSVSVGDGDFDWPVLDLSDSIPGLLVPPAAAEADSDGDVDSQLKRYADITGDTRHVADRSIQTLPKLRELLAAREADNSVPEDQSVVRLLDRVIEARQTLAPYVLSLTERGVELLSLSPSLRDAARSYLENWTAMWKNLRDLSQKLPREAPALREAADMLVLTDLRISDAGGESDVVVLPLHPIFLQPRLVAAEAFTAKPGSTELFEVVTAALDPAAPVISIPTPTGDEKVTFDGSQSGLLRYSSKRSAPAASSASRLLRTTLERFVSAHPFADASVCVCLVEPSPALVSDLRRDLGLRRVSERVTLVVVPSPSEEEAVRDALAKARESLEASDSSVAVVREVVLPGALDSLSQALQSNGLSPHVTFLLNVLDPGSLATIGHPGRLQGSVLSEWLFEVALVNDRPMIMPNPHKELSELVHIQQSVASVSTPVVRLNPLLRDGAAALLAELASRSTWVVASGQQAGMAAAPSIGTAQLLGRLSASDESAYVYSADALTLVEPALRLMHQSAWFATSAEEVFGFLAGTLRLALPEGVLGFFRAGGGELARSSVMERLGVAAVLNELRASHDDQLIVSLDTQVARDWLENREPPHRRADLLAFRWDQSGDVTLTAIEVKSTSSFSWETSQGQALVADAYEQVDLMRRLLRQVFGLDADEVGFATSRREVIKRQVFLDALQQWEDLRTAAPEVYRSRIVRLNELFESGPKEILASIYVVGVDAQTDEPKRHHGMPPAEVTVLGREWLQEALRPGGGAVAIPQDLLDVLEGSYDAGGEEAAQPGSESPEAHTETVDSAQPRDDMGPRVEEVNAGGETTPISPSSPPSSDDQDREAIARSVWDVLRARVGRVKRLDESRIVFGPSIVLVPFETEVGTKLAQLRSQEEDLARDLAVASVRVVNLPNEARMAGLELARQHRNIPDVAVLTRQPGSDISLSLGTRVTSGPCWVRLADLPHLLVGGAPGRGKSVFLRSLMWQMTRLYKPTELDLVLIDGKGMADYLDFESAEHFKSPGDFHVGADGALDLIADVVESRVPAMIDQFKTLAKEALSGSSPVHIRDIGDAVRYADTHDREISLRPLVLVIDEFAELMMTAPDRRRFEELVTKFVQRARALGGHLIAATQRPSVDVVPGVMKSNFARLALAVNSAVDSRVILDEDGAEQLLGKGDLLFKSPSEGLIRLQGYAALDHYI